MSNQNGIVKDQIYKVEHYSGNMTENMFIARGGTVNVKVSNTAPADIASMETDSNLSDLSSGYFTRPNKIPKYIAFEEASGTVTSIDWEGFKLIPYTP